MSLLLKSRLFDLHQLGDGQSPSTRPHPAHDLRQGHPLAVEQDGRAEDGPRRIQPDRLKTVLHQPVEKV